MSGSTLGTYLNAAFRDREKVKALGARWDPLARQWYVPLGRDTAPFAAWLPAGAAPGLPAAVALGAPGTYPHGQASAAYSGLNTGQNTGLVAAEPPAPWEVAPAQGAAWSGAGTALSSAALPPSASMNHPLAAPATATATAIGLGATGAAPGAGALAAPASLSLSQLLGGVAQAVAAAYRAGVWVRLEVLRADARRGHVYLEVAERDATGQTQAQARAMLWADVAQRVVPEFERATGVVLGAGIKLLVRARPNMHPLYGLSLVVDAIDPAFTLGDLEAKKREIRQRLQAEGLFEANRQLPAPWDYNAVLVIAPEGAAGLGDFRAEAQRLAALGLCEFVYAYSRFQGEGAAAEVRAALLAALARRESQPKLPPFDAVVLIRGGGAVNDLAWLNDYALARCVCELPVPVLTGIGHERDRTVLDEVAHQAFDTPSKVVGGIQQRIVQRAQQAQALFQQLQAAAARQVQAARQGSQALWAEAVGLARQQVQGARRHQQSTWAGVQQAAQRQLAQARQEAPTLLALVQDRARQQVHEARQGSQHHLARVLEPSRASLRHHRQQLAGLGQELAPLARRTLAEARQHSQGLLREITGQGPDKTLARGFALVRDAASGQPVTTAAQLQPGQALRLQFHDGMRAGVLSPSPSPSTDSETTPDFSNIAAQALPDTAP